METKNKTKTKTVRSSAKAKADAKTSKETLAYILEGMLKDIYWAEKYLIKVLPRMAKASFNEDLREIFEIHLGQTKHQILRIEDCFEIIGKKPIAKKCEAMEGLVKEGVGSITDHVKGHARDAALIAAVQKVEHYEISAYGTMRTMSTVLGLTKCAALLEETKDEEAETDLTLTILAEKINMLAAEVELEVETADL
jgi:ferritin-like metal-binding protein YciE